VANLSCGSDVESQTACVVLRRVARTARNGVRIEENMVDVTGCVPLAHCCAVMLGVANAVPRLIADGVLAADGLPYKHYLDWGYFALVQGTDGTTETVVTLKGQVWFGKRYQKAHNAH
jgi:hypothetical protein